MKKYYLDRSRRQIAKAVIRLEYENRKAGTKLTTFDKKIAAAVATANEEIEREALLPDDIVDKIRINILDGVTWENIGETYCSRETFYRYSRKYCFFVARALGMTDNKRRPHG